MINSTLSNVGINFNNLTSEGFAAFILALIFSIISLAAFIYYAKHKEINKVLVVVITLVFPFISIFCWVYLLMNLFAYPVTTSLYVALGCSAGYVVLAVCFAYALVAIINAAKKKAEQKASQTEIPVQEETTEETQENVEEENVVAPLLLPDAETEEATVEDVETVQEKITEEVIEEQPEETEEDDGKETVEVEVDEDSEVVVFANGPRKSFDELFNALSDEIKEYYNEVIEYAMSMPKTKRNDSKYHTTIKIGAMKLLNAKFQKEKLVCSFMAGSSELKNYSKAEKAVKIKEKPVVIEIDSEDAVVVAKNMIDIVFKNIEEARAAKKAEKKAKKEAAKQAEQEIGEIVEVVENPEESETQEEVAEDEQTSDEE